MSHSTLTAPRTVTRDGRHWVVTDDGREVSGPHEDVRDAETERHDRQPDHARPLFVVDDLDD